MGNNKEAVQKGLGLAKTKIFFGVLIFLLAVSGGVFGYFKYLSPAPAPPPDPTPPKKLINAVEKTIEMRDMEAAFGESNFEGSFLVFLPIEKREGRDYFLSPGEFFSAAKLNLPSKLRENISSYNIGAIGEGEGKRSAAFLIFEITSADEASQGLRIWEKNMQRELNIFFPALKLSLTKEFEDGIIRNQNARILGAENPPLIYLIFNKKLLIITGSRKTMQDILDRYLTFPPN